MCLVSKTNIPSTSTKNIPCYKILISVDGNLLTPYRDFPFPIGEVIVDKAKEKIFEVFGVFLIDQGYFHSYRTLEAAKESVKVLKRTLKKQVIKIYNAVIPTGVSYYIGSMEDICSKALQIIDECD